MSSENKTSAADGKRRSDKGAILFIVAACLVVLLGFMGLAIDLGHAYNNKSQLQNMADACALAGASALNGTFAGIQLATDRARDLNADLNNRTEFNAQTITLAEADVSFCDTLNGTYQNKAWAQGTPTTVKFVRVVIPPQPSQVVFAKLIPGIPDVINFGAEAVAGQHVLQEICNGLDPFSPEAINKINDPAAPGFDPNFGYQPDVTYMIRLATNGQGSGDTCQDAGFTNVVSGKFGFANVDPTCGGQGQGQNCFSNSLLNGSNRRCVGVNGTIPVQTGNFGINVIQDLRTRFNQDTDTVSTTRAAYHGNNRRILRVAFNAGPPGPGGSVDYTILGYGCFWMASLPEAKPAAPICVQYFGQCTDQGAPTGNSNEASLTQIVLFR